MVVAYSAGQRRRRISFARRAEPYAFIAPTALLMLGLMLVPIVIVIGYSFTDNVILNKNPGLVGFDNYFEIISDPTFVTAIRNTIFFVVASVAVHLLLGLVFALLLNSRVLGRWASAIFRGIFILPWLFTAAIVAVLWRMLLAPNGVVNYLLDTFNLASAQLEWLSDPNLALFAVTGINIWSGYPFFMISMLAGLQGIPGDLYEAAKVDGANAMQRFWNVTIPQLRPIIIAMMLLDFIWTSQQFALIWATTGGGPIDSTEMLSTYTYKLAFAKYEFALASTSAVLVLLLSMILAFFYVRHQRARD